MARRGLATAVAAVLGVGAALALADTARADPEVRLEHDGRTRTALIHRPAGLKGEGPWPLVLALHGGGGNARQMARATGLSRLADRAGFLVAYPNGTGRFRKFLLTWNAANCCGAAHREGADDVGFFSKLIDVLVAEHGADPRRVYVTGISNGAMMTYRLACRLADRIAAIAAVAGAFNEDDCRPARSVPVMIVHGTADRHVLYAGGAPEIRADPKPRVDRSVAAARDFWRRHNGCADRSKTEARAPVARERFTACPDGNVVEVVTILGGGHAWPGGRRGRLRGDKPTQAFSVNEQAWAFFLAHPR